MVEKWVGETRVFTKSPLSKPLRTTSAKRGLMDILPMYRQLWIDNPKLVNFWANGQFSQDQNMTNVGKKGRIDFFRRASTTLGNKIHHTKILVQLPIVYN
jgi:hypothetical protein